MRLLDPTTKGWYGSFLSACKALIANIVANSNELILVCGVANNALQNFVAILDPRYK